MAPNPRVFWIAAGAVAAGAFLVWRNRRDALQQEQSFKSGSASAASEKANPAPTSTGETMQGSLKDLSQFLAGETWFDETGWHSIWEREGIEAPEHWLRQKGSHVLATERTKLQEQPALLAGCRRRWIVVCRYAGMDVTDAAHLWNSTERQAA